MCPWHAAVFCSVDEREPWKTYPRVIERRFVQENDSQPKRALWPLPERNATHSTSTIEYHNCIPLAQYIHFVTPDFDEQVWVFESTYFKISIWWSNASMEASESKSCAPLSEFGYSPSIFYCIAPKCVFPQNAITPKISARETPLLVELVMRVKWGQ